MVDRRDFLKLVGTSGAALAVLGCAAPSTPLPSSVWKPLADNELPFAGLATSLPAEYDYSPHIEGTLPPALQGTLYRNGPGLFDRGGLRKRMLRCARNSGPRPPGRALLHDHAQLPLAPAPPGAQAWVRRYVIDPSARTLREETVAADEGYEMPFINPRFGCHRHRYGYFAQTGQADWFWSRVTRVDTQTGKVTSYDFGPGHYCSEPVFAPQPGLVCEAGAAAEPVALAHLTHRVPLSFHGYRHAEA
jgi:carotenoid cleavage dioxygenase-like enzyme